VGEAEGPGGVRGGRGKASGEREKEKKRKAASEIAFL